MTINLNDIIGLPERFWRKVDVRGQDDCWEWQAKRVPKGYGQFSVREPDRRYAHRVAYELTVGPIPEGLELDHLCRNPPCVNPRHLEPVTHRENVVRGTSLAAANARKTHCKRGHALTPDNLYISSGARHCRTCVLAAKWANIGEVRRRDREGARRRRRLNAVAS